MKHEPWCKCKLKRSRHKCEKLDSAGVGKAMTTTVAKSVYTGNYSEVSCAYQNSCLSKAIQIPTFSRVW